MIATRRKPVESDEPIVLLWSTAFRDGRFVNIFVLTLAAQAAVAQGSLGIGLDVLPVAYTFAANRLEFAPDLRLTSCDKMSCRWAAGHGVELAAYVSGFDLDIRRIEVSASNNDRAWFEKACLTLVSLTLSGADRSDVRAIAASIANPISVSAEAPERTVDGIRFYGTAGSGGSGVIQRCGATSRAD